ncbi:25S rRNA (adenine2142-N1)-methyltransferase [Elasticomyces elasticus]|nr:25S rRNA (adenine2142-N1)-methyltransferase [Elasticomyces elasticus]
MASSKPKKHKSLSAGRPPTLRRPAASLSSKATRTLIRSHHQLQKASAAAVKAGDERKAAILEHQIEQQGGLQAYQRASIQGQSTERGGDSSKVLLNWLADVSFRAPAGERLRMLEVGALSRSNACSRSSVFDVTRIDLRSQGSGIVQQDFMQRPLPKSGTEMFDIVSLSLVLNYVPDAAARGEMLRRTCRFLSHVRTSETGSDGQALLPALFLVFPAPCVINSRYLTEDLLSRIMASLGYTLLKRKLSTKLVYYLWRASEEPAIRPTKFVKTEVNPGVKRNNFCVVLE